MFIIPKLINNSSINSDTKTNIRQSGYVYRPENSKIYFKSRIMDNRYYRSPYNSINLGDHSIIVKRISLSNIFNINNSINTGTHPFSISLNGQSVLNDNDNSFGNIEQKRIKLYDNRKLKIKKAIIIQSFIRRFLTYKKYYYELQNIKMKCHNSKKNIYKKKWGLLKNYSYKKVANQKINKKNIDKNNFFFTKTIIVNSYHEKSLISKIQKYWRNNNLNYQIGFLSRINNYETHSEILKNFRLSNKISLTKRPKYDSLLFNSLKSFKEEPQYKNRTYKQRKNKKDDILLKNNKEIFDMFYLKNNHTKRPQYIKLYNKNDKTLKKVEYTEDNIYHYEINDINRSFKGKSFTLYHDNNKNGNYIQQVNFKCNLGQKLNVMKDNNDNQEENINQIIESKNIVNNLKIWKKNKLNIKFNEENYFKYKDLKPNKNFIFINSSKTEKLLKLERKKDIIDYPSRAKMRKINYNLKKNSTKKLKNVLSKFYINDDEIEPELILERKFIMKKPHIKSRNKI